MLAERASVLATVRFVPVEFLTDEQAEGYGTFAEVPTRPELELTSLHEALDTTTPGGRLVFHVFAALAVQPRTHRAGHQRVPGRRPRPRRPTRPPAGDDRGAGTSRPRPT
jgi:predicted DNA-binding protein with PD1-like motif